MGTLEGQDTQTGQGADYVAPTIVTYMWVTLGLVVVGGGVGFAAMRAPSGAVPREALVGPMLALFGLIAFVWLLMVLARNYSILAGLQDGEYYRRYDIKLPPDWVERPARVFNNLMQVPQLFYAISLLCIVLERVDGPQLVLAWSFVALRLAHAIAYLVWNYLPVRFGLYVASSAACFAMMLRFALY